MTDARTRLRICLYIAGKSPNSVLALANARSALKPYLDDATLEVVDVLDDPQRCWRDGILATPTLVKLAPLPEQRIVGTLQDREALLRVLGPLVTAANAE